MVARAEDAATPVLTQASALADTDPADDVRDGDSPPGGPILPVPETPDELTSAESLISQEDGEPEQAQPMLLTVARAPAQTAPPTFPVPARRRRWISVVDINLAAQTLQFRWSDGTLGPSVPISSGRGRPCTADDPCANQNNQNCTPASTFHPAFLGDAGYHNNHGDAMAWYVDLGVLDAQGHTRGIGIHDSQPVFGRPASHGCVRVQMDIARTINQNVIRSTAIVIHGKAATVPWRDQSCP